MRMAAQMPCRKFRACSSERVVIARNCLSLQMPHYTVLKNCPGIHRNGWHPSFSPGSEHPACFRSLIAQLSLSSAVNGAPAVQERTCQDDDYRLTAPASACLIGGPPADYLHR